LAIRADDSRPRIADQNMLATEILARNVVSRGNRPFLVHEGRQVSYREFDRLANAAGNALRSLGVTKGDRVSLALGNSIDYLVVAFGILKTGAILHPVHLAMEPGHLAYVLGHAEPRVLVAATADATRLRPGDGTIPQGTIVATVGPPAAADDATVASAGDTVSLDSLLADAPRRRPPVKLAPDDAALLLYTAGTTGPPKGALFTHAGVGASGRPFVDALIITCDDVVLTVSPLVHENAWAAVQAALYAGAAVAFPRAFHPPDFWLLVHQTGATILFTLGGVLATLLARKESFLERTNRLRIVFGIGSTGVRDEVRARLRVDHVADGFGSTDAGAVTIDPAGAPLRAGSSGPPAPGVRIRIIDAEGRELPAGQVGEISVESPSRLASYFRDPEATSRALRDGWFLTDDLGYVDADGWLYFVDRKPDAIRRGAEYVSSLSIERILRGHPKVAEAAVIGVPDPVLGQEIKAFIVPAEPLTADELRTFAEERLAAPLVPRFWELRTSLPKTLSQRLAKHTLRES
jgi:acyl-CoA synthetase (AMP-forming)/AMP-acid ligase II